MRGHAAVDHEVVAGDVRRIAGREKRDGRCNLVREADAPHRDEALVFGSHHRLVLDPVGVGVDRPRAHGVDADTVARVVDRQAAREVDHTALGGAVRGEAVVAGQPGDRCCVDDVATGLLQMGNRVLGAEVDRVEVGRDRSVPVGCRQLGHDAEGRDRRVVHEHIELAETLDRRLDQRCDLPLVAHVGQACDDAVRVVEVRREPRQGSIVQVGDDKVRPLVVEALGSSPADAVRAAGDDHDSIREALIDGPDRHRQIEAARRASRRAIAQRWVSAGPS